MSRGDDTSASAPPALAFPAGTVAYPSQLAGIKHGVYAGPPGRCCFLGGSSTVTLSKPKGTRVAKLDFYVPAVAPYASHGLIVTVHIFGASKTSQFKPGSNSMELPLPSQTWAATLVPMQITATPTFVPKNLGLNGDTRTLSTMLLSVSYSN